MPQTLEGNTIQKHRRFILIVTARLLPRIPVKSAIMVPGAARALVLDSRAFLVAADLETCYNALAGYKSALTLCKWRSPRELSAFLAQYCPEVAQAVPFPSLCQAHYRRTSTTERNTFRKLFALPGLCGAFSQLLQFEQNNLFFLLRFFLSLDDRRWKRRIKRKTLPTFRKMLYCYVAYLRFQSPENRVARLPAYDYIKYVGPHRTG